MSHSDMRILHGQRLLFLRPGRGLQTAHGFHKPRYAAHTHAYVPVCEHSLLKKNKSVFGRRKKYIHYTRLFFSITLELQNLSAMVTLREKEGERVKKDGITACRAADRASLLLLLREIYMPGRMSRIDVCSKSMEISHNKFLNFREPR